jgi:hypothetical protein
MFVWWLVFNPGFFSADSFTALELARSGDLPSGSTAIWALTVKALTFGGSQPQIATLFFSQLFALSISVFSHQLLPKNVSLFSSALLCATPLVGAMGITLWHDIPMTTGFLFVISGVFQICKNKPFPNLLLILGLILVGFRFNGLPTVLLSILILIVFFKCRAALGKLLLYSLVILFSMSLLDSNLASNASTQQDGLINWMRYDLSCYAASVSDSTFEQLFSAKTNRDYWKSSQACTWFNNSTAFSQKSPYVTNQIPSAWLSLAVEDPFFVITTHLKRHSYLFPLPVYGLPNPPFLHTTIEKPNMNVEFWNAEVANLARNYPRIWNFFNFVFAYSGLWLLLILILAWTKRSSFYLLVALFGLVLNAGIFIFAIIPDARFSLFPLVSSQLIVVAEIYGYMLKKSKLSKNSSDEVDDKPR